MSRELRVRPLAGIPEINEGDDLGELIAAAARPGGDEVVVISQKPVSKAEGRLRRLSEVTPGAEARELAERVEKDPALVELILAESNSVIRAAPGVLITETNGGWICANAGIDSSNVPGDDTVALLPVDADLSARGIRESIEARSGALPAVIVADTFGRPWRLGQTDVALGCAGISAVADWRGRRDAQGRELAATAIAVADELASAADLVREKDEGVPGAVISGVAQLVEVEHGPGAAALRRAADEDLFR